MATNGQWAPDRYEDRTEWRRTDVPDVRSVVETRSNPGVYRIHENDRMQHVHGDFYDVDEALRYVEATEPLDRASDAQAEREASDQG